MVTTNKNYRGRFEGNGGNIEMVAEGRRQTMNFGKYNKFWVAAVGFGLTAITGFTGIDLQMFGITPEAVIGFVTAVLVYAVPNDKTKLGY